ncbi:MAG TPA: hypothetical protein GX717_09485, partial [Clostridiaceae bacterium]|nr:hypothetical protein [Clostridiaceae bacterium]
LAVLISLLRYLPKPQADTKAKPIPAAPTPGMTTQSGLSTNDEEERMVAMLVASCVAKDNYAKDVRVVSIQRVK